MWSRPSEQFTSPSPPVPSTAQIVAVPDRLTTQGSLHGILDSLPNGTRSQVQGPIRSSPRRRETIRSSAARHPFLTTLLQDPPLLSIAGQQRRCEPPSTYQRTHPAVARPQTVGPPARPSADFPVRRRTIATNSVHRSKRRSYHMSSLNVEPMHVCANDCRADAEMGSRAEEAQERQNDSTTEQSRLWRLENSLVPHLHNLEQADETRMFPPTNSSGSNFSSPATASPYQDCTNSVPGFPRFVDTASIPSTSGAAYLGPEITEKSPADSAGYAQSAEEESSPAVRRDSVPLSCQPRKPSFRSRWSSSRRPAMPTPTQDAWRVATSLIRHARNNNIPEEHLMRCPDCKKLPTQPVTGQCGHTRCKTCIQDLGACPCGTPAPQTLLVNTLVQELIEKMLLNTSRCTEETGNLNAVSRQGMLRGENNSRRAVNARACEDVPPRMPMSLVARYQHSRQLLIAERYREAAPHLARVAVEGTPLSRTARKLLAQCITILSRDGNAGRVTRCLFRAIREQSALTWLQSTDLECVLCYHTFVSPVTTPCGHSYCRTCIERSMDYKKTCALCLRSLGDFNLVMTRDTEFVCAALESIDALVPPLPPDPNVIPIFVCTVAFPTIPCPLFIFDPRYWLMIRRVLESGSRKFGMVAYERDRTFSDYGVVLEVRDCVHLEDGRSILSTVGVSRFKVIERDVRDGCDVARIQPLMDILPTADLLHWELHLLATQITYKALIWLNTMDANLRSEIEVAFGPLPQFDLCHDFWDCPDGPAWMWWLIAILPLRSEIKVLILSTVSLRKRMLAVSRTLEAITNIPNPMYMRFSQLFYSSFDD